LTKDGAQKTNLRWTPDGQSLIFITGKCVKIVQLEDARVEMITCFDTAAVLDSFEISPDGKQVAISIDHEHMYVVPYDLEKLKTVKYRRDLAPMGACKPLSPYDREYVKSVRWSADGQKIALVFAAPIGGKRVDTIRVIDVSQCYDSPPRSGVEFPGGFLTISGYDKNPTIINFGWDGYFSFALTGIVRNGGFGDLYFFNHETNSPDLRVNPIDGNCCYRDPSYSPDGRFLLFAYQEYSETNKIELYMIQIGEIGTGLKFTPIPLPEDFFSDRTESPQPVARPAP
jgi:Tol biopolymer transport system component